MKNFEKTIIIYAAQFSDKLVNRNSCYGMNNAVHFREKYLSELQNNWNTGKINYIIDFEGVEKMSPSFANEAFAYFTQFGPIENKIQFRNMTYVQYEILEMELKNGYQGNYKIINEKSEKTKIKIWLAIEMCPVFLPEGNLETCIQIIASSMDEEWIKDFVQKENHKNYDTIISRAISIHKVSFES